MSNLLLGGIRRLLRSDTPRWACEFSRSRVVVVQASSDRNAVVSRAQVTLPEGAIVPDVKGANVGDRSAVQSALREALDEARFTGSELIVVIPDDAVRITLLATESFPASESDRQSFIRWKLKKNVPFDVSSAHVAYEVLGENPVVDLLTVLAPEVVTRQYEDVVDSLDLHPGIVNPSTTAALNLINGIPGATNTLFVKLSETSVVTSILTNGKLRFYRKVPRQGPLESAIYPTLMYFEDKLDDSSGGRGIREMIVCTGGDGSSDLTTAARQLGLSVRPLLSAVIDDVYKPAFGALQG